MSNGKGSKRRPENARAFRENFDAAFRKLKEAPKVNPQKPLAVSLSPHRDLDNATNSQRTPLRQA